MNIKIKIILCYNNTNIPDPDISPLTFSPPDYSSRLFRRRITRCRAIRCEAGADRAAGTPGFSRWAATYIDENGPMKYITTNTITLPY
jgi:hypothetical protein